MIVAPRRLMRVLSGSPGSAVSTGVVRFLGFHEATEATLTSAAPSPRIMVIGAASDGLHALSMVGLAAASPRYRRPALVSALLATTSCVVGMLALRQPSVAARDQIAA